MSIGRSVKAVLGGIAAFAVFAVLGEMTLRVIARLVARWRTSLWLASGSR